MKTNNPVLKKMFDSVSYDYTSYMTIQGTIAKTAICFSFMLLSAAAAWYLFLTNSAIYMPLTMAGVISGLILGFITIFKTNWAPITAPLYSLSQGLVVGGISAFASKFYPGIVPPAISLTIGVFATILFLYKTEIIRVTENFRIAVIAATGGVFIMAMLSLILSFFGVNMLPLQNGLIGIIISFFTVGVAAFNLALDFDFIHEGTELKLPKQMEWYAAFGLLVTLIWLYIEILNLIMKLAARK